MDAPAKSLLILDLDETLIHAREAPLEHEAAFRVSDLHVYIRPHLERFLTECASRFLLAVWSAGSDDYVTEVVQRIFPAGLQPEFIWGRSRCTYAVDRARVGEDGYFDPGSHYGYVKKLGKLKRRGYRLGRMLIVDDTPAKCIHNYGNAIYVLEYDGREHDTELLDLARYLATLAEVPDVRTLEKRNWRNQLA